ncbi:MAG: LysM peptidoglycan-binding domain-containing protein [Desulfobulbus sp.]|nr:MAG: LysM peptidoglycan-binding domain-containing protein [Desulfobulbus sp.]
MKQSISLITFLLPAVFAISILSGCAQAPVTTYVPLENELYANVNFDKGHVVIQYTENEPEVALEEELKELTKIGGWEEETSGQSQAEIAVSEQTTYDFPIVMNKQVEFYLNLFQTKQRGYYERWLARSTKYLPYIKSNLRQAGLPEDLAYLAMIESGYNPTAISKAKAVGLWQFIAGTGKNYGLRIDSWVDERREPDKATLAAIKYLTFLYEEFGSWYLAVAAYNAGEGKIGRGIERYKTEDFWHLASKDYLSLETKRYVPKLIAAIIIAKNPEKYGFSDINYQQPPQFDTIPVPPMTDLHAVAMASGEDIETIRDLNNELLKNLTPPGKNSYELRIPAGTYERVASNLARLQPVASIDYKTHVVKKGDTLTAICRTYNLSKTALLKANNLHTAKLVAGQRLRIPYQTTKYVLLKEGEKPAKVALAEFDGDMQFHRVKKGETLSKIASLYGVTAQTLMQWNNLQSIHKIAEGQQLALFLDKPVQPAIVAQQKPDMSTATAMVASEKSASDATLKAEFKKRPAGAVTNQEKITYHQVKSGDTLWSIAQKYRITLEKLRKWNNLKSNNINVGAKLVIKKA